MQVVFTKLTGSVEMAVRIVCVAFHVEYRDKGGTVQQTSKNSHTKASVCLCVRWCSSKLLAVVKCVSITESNSLQSSVCL